MSRKKSNLSRLTKEARRLKLMRKMESPLQREIRLAILRRKRFWQKLEKRRRSTDSVEEPHSEVVTVEAEVTVKNEIDDTQENNYDVDIEENWLPGYEDYEDQHAEGAPPS